MKNVRIFVSDSYDPFYNLALEEYLFNIEKICMFLWQNDKTVVIGRYQNVYEEVNLQYARENGVKVVRRNSGGGAVYHDMGNLNYSFIIDNEESNIEYCKNLVLTVLANISLNFRWEGRNDILVKGYKVSGSAFHIEGSKMLFHGTLLINSDLDILNKVLTRNNKISNSLAQKSNSRKVMNISRYAPDISVDDIIHLFEKELKQKLIIIKSNNSIEKLKFKYQSNEWNYGFMTEYNYTNVRRFKGGTIQINAIISDGIIQSIKFKGDYFTLKDVDELEKNMQGINLSSGLFKRLCEINAGSYFIDISEENIVDLFSDILVE